MNFAHGRIPLGDNSPQNVYIVFQPRRRSNIVQSLVDLHWATSVQWRSQDAKPVEICWGSQTPESISAVSEQKFTILWGHVEEILLFNRLFSDCRYMPYLRRESPTNLCHGAQMAIFGLSFASCISASRVQHVSDLHSKFALRLHHVWNYDRHRISDSWD